MFLKYADLTPLKDDKTDKENYIPISILPVLIIAYEWLKNGQFCSDHEHAVRFSKNGLIRDIVYC